MGPGKQCPFGNVRRDLRPSQSSGVAAGHNKKVMFSKIAAASRTEMLFKCMLLFVEEIVVAHCCAHAHAGSQGY